MKLFRWLMACVLCSASMQMTACSFWDDQPSPYAKIMQHLKNSVAPKYYVQIAGAINMSPHLKNELSELAESEQFTGFIVNERNRISDSKATLFGGFTKGTKIVLTTEYLQVLQKSRYSSTPKDKSMKADNTLFALAHLAHHLQISINPKQYDSTDLYEKAKLRDEAAAYVEGWNAMLDEAREQNHGKNLTPSQVWELLGNTRYNAAFQGLQHWNSDGTIREDADSLEHIEQTLVHSALVDIE